ncbi:hypothetical protein [Thermosynechococcus sp. M55_K2018_012]|uniref:hypothetical protein n=1 Tax=Thermosynechococcus sp. M55_K2018_012 TaxID=2747809 RepID=UPI0019EF34AB|nr:hypothetical protein [Thermosynechococcus sp. M55_K2018_012]HIK48182.1 hypothetical protein [Thermosynechococcus sp. M55_K2018_012]
MKLLSLILINSGLATSLTLPARAISQPYPPVAVNSFMDTCIERGRRSAPLVPRSMMSNICQCSINYIQQRVSYADFQTLDPNGGQPPSPRRQQAQRVLDESVNYCIRQQLGV